MAKKIRLDFSKTEERSGWNTKHIPEGLHRMKIDSVQETEAQDGTAMLVYALVPEASAFKARRFPYYCKLQQNQLWKLRDLIVAAGGSVPKRAVQIDPASIVGKSIAVEIEDDNYQGNLRSQVNGTYGLDILDDEAGDTTPDDEDEEGEEPEDEEYEDDEAEEEAEEEEEGADLTVLSLAELRKMAKALGVDTTGLKKAELIESIEEEEAEAEDEEEEEGDDLTDDDLTDEDLEDEDFEEEEEEPTPAPKRRVAKAPAKAPVKKAAAPAAKAPAKRVVKRR